MTSTKTRLLGFLAAGLAIAVAHADDVYTGTWEVSKQAAGTLTLRLSGDRVTGSLVGNTGKRRTGHMHGTFTGKRFKVMVYLRGRRPQEFQGNITHDEGEAHMDGLLYLGNKPVGDIRLNMNATKAMPLHH